LNENSTAYRAPVEHGRLAWAAFGPSHAQLQHQSPLDDPHLPGRHFPSRRYWISRRSLHSKCFPDPRKAADYANDWAAHLHLRANGKSLPLQVQGIRSEIVPAPAANDEANGVFMDAEIQQMMEKARL
jgi:hypothetical protein